MATTKCPRCINPINAAATRCQHCHADFTPDELASIRAGSSGSKILLGICGAVLGLAVLGSIIARPAPPRGANLSTPAAVDTADAQAVATADAAMGNMSAPAPEAAPQSNWTYDRRRDELRGRDIVEARIRSTNSVNLGFPYGDTHLTILVRQHPEYGRDVIFIADEGQIVCSVTGCRGSISFDGAAQRISLNDSADYNPTVVFAASAAPLIDRLKRSRRTIVELPFYQNGNPQFTFDTTGLRWPPAGSGGDSGR